MRPANSARTSRLAALITTPDAVGTAGIDLETLRRIQLFRGLILRVKHSFIWNMAPLTSARLERTGLLLRAFADYGVDHPLTALDGTPQERTQRFLEHLSRGTLPTGARVDGVARHELHLLFSSPEKAASPKAWAIPTQSCHFRLATRVKMEAYDGRPDHCSGASLSPMSAAAVLVFYKSGRCRIVQDVAEVRSLRVALAGSSLDSVVFNSKRLPPGGDLRLFEDLCADGFLVVEQVWTV